MKNDLKWLHLLAVFTLQVPSSEPEMKYCPSGSTLKKKDVDQGVAREIFLFVVEVCLFIYLYT
jgi:hypothetical protein